MEESHPHQPPRARPGPGSREEVLAWRAELPVFSPLLMRDVWAVLAAAPPAVLVLAVGVSWLREGTVAWGALGWVAASLAGGALAILLLALVLMRAVHGRTYTLAYRLDREGVRVLRTAGARRDQAVLEAAAALGAARHAAAEQWRDQRRREGFLPWSAVTSVKSRPERGAVSLRRGWAPPFRLYLPEPELRRRALELIRRHRPDLFAA
jgi:hypothetical protein